MIEHRQMSIQDLVNEFKHGEMQLPAMQRGYVWKSTQVRDLLDSLYRGYPTGNILRWETRDDSIEVRNAAITQDTKKFSKSYLLLDGQQRLTSLAAVLQGEKVTVKDSNKPIDIYFNLDYKEDTHETEIEEDQDEVLFESDDDDDSKEENDPLENYDKPFIVANNRVKQKKNWISVTEFFKLDDTIPFLKRIGATDLANPKTELYQNRLNKLKEIKKYKFPVVTLQKDLEYDEVADIFVRVNSLGTKLKGSDLALAQITSKWHGALDVFEDYYKECKKTNWDVSIGTLLRTLVAITTGQSKFKAVSSLSLQNLQSGWEKTREAVSFALAYLTQNFDIENQSLLSSPYFITTLAYFVYVKDKQITEQETNLLKRWFLIANAKGRYSWGSSETKLDEDLAAIKSGSLEKLLVLITRQFSRLDITEDDLRGRNRTSGFFKTMFTLMHRNKARDWNTDLVISVKHPGKKDKIEFHHIFPKNILKERKFDLKDINDIANLTFIGKITNIKISDNSPDIYLDAIVKQKGEGILAEHCIPSNRDLWKVENYKEFMEERRKLLTKMLNDYLNSIMDNSEENASKIDIEQLLNQKEDQNVEFKSSFRWDTKEKRVNKKLEFVIGKTICGFMNSKDGGTLLIGVDDAGNVLGLENDYSNVPGNNWDGFQKVLTQYLGNVFGNETCLYWNNLRKINKDGKDACLISVKPSNKPVYIKNEGQEEFYVRVASKTTPLSMSEAQLYIKDRFK